MTVDIAGLLRAEGPYAPDAEELMLYGQFAGSWDVEATWYTRDGGRSHGTGEWHFGWILGGRGIQDVLFASGASPEAYGTTLRCYDREQGVWHVSWMQPAGREFVHLVGRRVGGQIVQEALVVDDGERRRWSFTDVTPATFTWLGEVSADGSSTWFLEQKMTAARRLATSHGGT